MVAKRKKTGKNRTRDRVTDVSPENEEERPSPEQENALDVLASEDRGEWIARLTPAVQMPSGTRFEDRYLPIHRPAAEALHARQIAAISITKVRGRFPFQVARKDPGWHVLMVSLAGRGRVSSDERTHHLARGEAAVMPAHTPHVYQTGDHHWRYLLFALRDRERWSWIRDHPVEKKPAPLFKELEAAVEGYAGEAIRADENSESALAHYSELIALNVVRTLEPGLNRTANNRREQLLALWNHVNGNLREKWRVADLAAALHVSPQHFYVIASREMGVRPMQMVTKLRIERAAEMLRIDEMPVKTIADIVGYRDPFTFSAAFKRNVGMSPRAFRTQSRKQELSPGS